jgi:hypothetical protein
MGLKLLLRYFVENQQTDKLVIPSILKKRWLKSIHYSVNNSKGHAELRPFGIIMYMIADILG